MNPESSGIIPNRAGSGSYGILTIGSHGRRKKPRNVAARARDDGGHGDIGVVPRLGPRRGNDTVGATCCMILFYNGIQQAWSSVQRSRVIVFYLLARAARYKVQSRKHVFRSGVYIRLFITLSWLNIACDVVIMSLAVIVHTVKIYKGLFSCLSYPYCSGRFRHAVKQHPSNRTNFHKSDS